MADRKFSQDMAGAWGLMRQKEKVLMILQSILTAILLIFIIIDVGMGMNKGWMLKTELGRSKYVTLDQKVKDLNCYCAVCFKCPESLSGEEESNRFLCAAYLGGSGLFYTPVYINGKILTNVCGYATIHGDSKYNFERIKRI